MKTIILILNLAFNAVVASSAPVTVQLFLKDAMTTLPVEGIEVIVLSEDGQELAQGKSDKKGHFETSIEMPKQSNEIRIKLLASNDLYAAKEVFLFKGKEKVISSEINLVPSEKMYAMWFVEHDSIYGGEKEGVLAPEFNTNKLMCGCRISDVSEAEFKGGQAEMYKFTNSELRYPQESIEMNEQGKVYLKFIVEEDGKITHIKIERGTSPTLDAEAYRVVRAMPNWIPAECNGKKIRSVARMPFNFTLQ